jgi:hypothetical protein
MPLVSARGDGFGVDGVHDGQDEQVEHATAQHIPHGDILQ